MLDSLIPPVGAVSQSERMFRVNWVANLQKTPSGVPFVTADFTAKQGWRVRVVDVRQPDELVGVLGHVPGSDWIPLDRVATLASRIDPDDPVILISGGEERAHDAAELLSKKGMRFVAYMAGGIMSWRDLGYSTTRDRSILERRDVLREIDRGLMGAPEHVTAEHVQKHVGDRVSVKWIKFPALLVRGLVSCVDGRDDSGVVGSPGGDVGELLVGLRALEKMLRRDLTDAEIATLLARRLDAFGRCYMHTDVDASNKTMQAVRSDARFAGQSVGLDEPLAWRKFLAAPPRDVQDALLEHALRPEHVGCGHLRLALLRPGEYDVREGLVTALLRSFHRQRWEGTPELEVVALGGGHTERAVLNVRTSGPLMPFSRIPLVSPSVGGAQVFVYHPRVTSYLRKQLARFLALQTDIAGTIDAFELHIEMERLGATQLTKTLGALAKGLPIYDVTFNGDERIDVRFGGVVGA